MSKVFQTSPRLAAAAAAAALLAGCASGKQGSSVVSAGERPVRVTTAGGTYEARVNDVVRAEEMPVAATPERVWAVLPGVFGELGLAFNGMDERARQIELRAVRARGRVGKTRLSTYLSCGTSLAGGGNNADMYDVTLNVVSRVAPGADASSSTVSTFVTASARPVAVSGSEVACGTTGQLENAIAKLVSVRVAQR